MIVDPDFLDHWKTTMLCDLLDDSSAPLCVIRLWGHCQQRRGWKFDIPAKGVKALCKYKGDAEALDQALQDCEFILRDGQSIEVIGWDEHNATLIANWENGKKGGRPPKNKPKKNPSKTHGLPMANPDQTHQEPIRCDEIGLDGIGDKNTYLAPATPDANQSDQIGKAKAIQIIELFNQVKSETGANWVSVSDPGNTSKNRYSLAIGRAKFVKSRLERQGKPSDWPAIMIWFETLYRAWANDNFYSGGPSAKFPEGYKRSFDSLHAEKAFCESVDRMVDQ